MTEEQFESIIDNINALKDQLESLHERANDLYDSLDFQIDIIHNMVFGIMAGEKATDRYMDLQVKKQCGEALTEEEDEYVKSEYETRVVISPRKYDQ